MNWTKNSTKVSSWRYRRYNILVYCLVLYLHGIIYNSQDKRYNLFLDIFRTIIDRHAPLKTKRRRGNQAKILTKELSKFIMNKSRFKNKYLKWPSLENFLAYKKAETENRKQKHFL